MGRGMRLSEIRYSVPKNLIAQYPVEPRDASRLMVVDRSTGTIEHQQFTDILKYLRKGDCLVVNNTKVYPARMYGKKEKTNAHIEVIMLRDLRPEDKLWEIFVEPARKVRIGNKIYFDDYRFYCEILDNTTSRGRTVRFNYQGDIYQVLERIGEMPLPSYITRKPTEHDKLTYQTIFAERLGSVVVPSAGLHFTKGLVSKLKRKGVKIVPITLHLSYSALEWIDVEDLTRHKMYAEYFEIPKESVEVINKALQTRKRVIAVGCSVARALESSVLASGIVKVNKGWTDKFIYPPYQFKIISGLLTNFHPPRSTSALLAAAFAGKELFLKAIKTAIKERYRFYVYGDAMLILGNLE